MLRAAVLHELIPQLLNDSVEHRKRPAPFEDPFRSLIVRRLALIAWLARREFKRQDCSATAFERATAVFFVGYKEFQRGQKKRPEAALFRVGAIEIPPFQHADEEFLREILSLVGGISAPAQVGIERIPVVLAQGNQGGLSVLPA